MTKEERKKLADAREILCEVLESVRRREREYDIDDAGDAWISAYNLAFDVCNLRSAIDMIDAAADP